MKKKVLLLVGLMLCLLLVGCGKSSDSPAKPINMIPDPNDYFSGAEITLVRNDEKGVYYMVENIMKTIMVSIWMLVHLRYSRTQHIVQMMTLEI